MRPLLILWFFSVTGALGLIENSDITEIAFESLSASIGLFLAFTTLVGVRRRHGPMRRLVIRATAVVVASTLYACLRASILWGGFATGEMTRISALAIFIFLANVEDRRILLFYGRLLRLFGAYGSGLILLYVVTGIYPPGYLPVSPASRFEGLHITPSTLLVAAIAAEILLSKQVSIFRIAYLVAAQALEGHVSLLLCTLMMVGTLSFTAFQRRAAGDRRPFSLIPLIVVGLVLFTMTLLFTDIVDRALNSESITSRLHIGERRMSDFYENFWFGVGSPGRTSTIAKDYLAEATDRFTETVRTSDIGYLDLLLRFGVAGTIPYLGFWIYTGIVALRRRLSWRDLCYPVLVLGFLLANVTLSVFGTASGLFAVLSVLTMQAWRAEPGVAPFIRIAASARSE